MWGIILYQFPTGLQRTSGKNRKDIFLQVLGWNCRRRLVPPGTSLRNSGPQARAVTGGKRAGEETMWISWEISMSVRRGRVILWKQTTPKSQWLKKQTAGPCSCPSPVRLGWQSRQRPGERRRPPSPELPALAHWPEQAHAHQSQRCPQGMVTLTLPQLTPRIMSPWHWQHSILSPQLLMSYVKHLKKGRRSWSIK